MSTELQLQVARNDLAVMVNDQEKKIHVLESLSWTLGEATGEVNSLKESVNRLNDMIEKSLDTGGRECTVGDTDETFGPDDALILHDSLFKGIKEGIMKKGNLSVKMFFTPMLERARKHVVAMQEKPKVLVLHCGTNDLHDVDGNKIVEEVASIYEIWENRGIKMIYSYITPRGENILTAKAEVVNSRVVQMFAEKSEVYISRNDRFYWRGTINSPLFDDDKIHLNDEGTRALASITKETICRALNIQMESRPRRGGRYNRNFRRDR